MIKAAMFDTKSFDKESFAPLAREAGISIKYFETKLGPDTADLARGYDATITFVNDDLSAEVIGKLKECGVRLLALRCAGFNNVDLKAASGQIPIARVPAYSPHAVAEHAMAMLLASVRRIHKAYNRTKDFNFSLSGLTGFDLYGKTVGVIGTGKIGRCFIDICRGFGMQVLAYDPYPAQDSDICYVPLAELFEKSDIISLHCPLTPQTDHIIDAAAIGQMKKGVFLINTSRGALIDAEALLSAIKDRHVGAACLDVYEEESDLFFEDYSGHIVEDDTLARLITMPNVLITSHQAFLTQEALHNIAKVTLQNISDFFERGELANEVSYAKMKG